MKYKNLIAWTLSTTINFNRERKHPITLRFMDAEKAKKISPPNNRYPVEFTGFLINQK